MQERLSAICWLYLLQVTEAALAELFQDCGQIMDCRVCGDPHTAMRFAFIEFEEESAVQQVDIQPALMQDGLFHNHNNGCQTFCPCQSLPQAILSLKCADHVLMLHCMLVSAASRRMYALYSTFLAAQAIKLSGHVVGAYPLRVRPSKTAIVPVNRTYLPRTDEERELCSRTVYAANIDKKVDAPHIRQFFQSLCGECLLRHESALI